ncbi:Sjoegren syndrome nuclear autoantigen 1 homolog [Microtus oregoni]|uniref:Sjoegren syndrome nuclear autoantigen 1 homolog n=1 Tax=Microtus oregoni TaxID=111838 RepID=UPI001BB23BDF|nr:Sjoegren syndrome nuclear autoantigen 1 homolog [Microtus oregoni]
MTQQGVALQNYNNELVKCIEELCQKREELCRQIQQEEDEKQRLQNEVRQLTEKLARVNENLARKIASRNEFDQTIAETEAAYLKILESSQTLLNVLKREAGNLTKATAPDQKSSGSKDSCPVPVSAVAYGCPVPDVSVLKHLCSSWPQMPSHDLRCPEGQLPTSTCLG